jgi:hypothetical protein
MAKSTKKFDLIFSRRHFFFSHFKSEIITDLVFGAEKRFLIQYCTQLVVIVKSP